MGLPPCFQESPAQVLASGSSAEIRGGPETPEFFAGFDVVRSNPAIGARFVGRRSQDHHVPHDQRRDVVLIALFASWPLPCPRSRGRFWRRWRADGNRWSPRTACRRRSPCLCSLRRRCSRPWDRAVRQLPELRPVTASRATASSAVPVYMMPSTTSGVFSILDWLLPFFV